MPVSNRDIDALIRDLSEQRLAADACNEYAPGDANNAIRRANLRLYLREMAAREPTTLLVMEGARLSRLPLDRCACNESQSLA